MRMTLRLLLAFLVICALPAMPLEGSDGDIGRDRHGSTLVRLEGTVVSVDETTGEAGLQVVRIELKTGEQFHRILLAPSAVLQEIDFPVEPGDRIRVRSFLAEPGEDAAAHKALNMTQGRMVRLRTLHRDPLWDSSGSWQGGPGRRHGRGGDLAGRGPGPHGKGLGGDR